LNEKEEEEHVPSEISVVCVALFGTIMLMCMENVYVIIMQTITRRNKIYF